MPLSWPARSHPACACRLSAPSNAVCVSCVSCAPPVSARMWPLAELHLRLALVAVQVLRQVPGECGLRRLRLQIFERGMLVEVGDRLAAAPGCWLLLRRPVGPWAKPAPCSASFVHGWAAWLLVALAVATCCTVPCCAGKAKQQVACGLARSATSCSLARGSLRAGCAAALVTEHSVQHFMADHPCKVPALCPLQPNCAAAAVQ